MMCRQTRFSFPLVKKAFEGSRPASDWFEGSAPSCRRQESSSFEIFQPLGEVITALFDRPHFGDRLTPSRNRDRFAFLHAVEELAQFGLSLVRGINLLSRHD